MIRDKCEQRTLLPRRLFNFGSNSISDQSVMRFKFLQGFRGIIYESEASCFSTTKLCAKTENAELILACLIHLGQFATEIILGDIGAAGMEDVTVSLLEYLLPFNCLCRAKRRESPRGAGLIGHVGNLHDHLLSIEKRIAQELASSQRDRKVAVRHFSLQWFLLCLFPLLGLLLVEFTCQVCRGENERGILERRNESSRTLGGS